MKNLNKYIQEKLIVNKNFKSIGADGFFDLFIDKINSLKESGVLKKQNYFDYNKYTDKYANYKNKEKRSNISELFNVNNYGNNNTGNIILYQGLISPSYDKNIWNEMRQIYNDMMSYIINNEKHINFIIKYNNKRSNYYVRAFKTFEYSIALFGNLNIPDKKDPSFWELGEIVFMDHNENN